MNELPFELRYTLTRRQRLIPHLKLWGPLAILLPGMLIASIACMAVT